MGEDVYKLLEENESLVNQIRDSHPPVKYEDWSDVDQLREKGKFEIDLLYKRARKKVDRIEKEYNKQKYAVHNAKLVSQKKAKKARKNRKKK